MKKIAYPLAAASIFCATYLSPHSSRFFWWGQSKPSTRVFAAQYQANSPIEDRFDSKILKHGATAVAVYDGHGGEHVAELAKSQLLSTFSSSYEQRKGQEDSIQDMLKKAYSHVENKFYVEALQSYKVGFGKMGRVGSCALVTVIKDRELTAANVGDCRGIIINTDKTSVQINNQHNAARPNQQAKLKAKFPNDQDIVLCKTPKACYVKGRLQPTRVLGDFHLKHSEFNNPQNHPRNMGYAPQIENFKGFYVSNEPEFSKFTLKQNDRFIVLGSDGLWDQLTNAEVASLVVSHQNSPQSVPQLLIEKALEKVSARTKLSISQIKEVEPGLRRGIHDDITVVLVDLG